MGWQDEYDEHIRKQERERCARIADGFADTKADMSKSDNPSTAMAIAAIMSETGKKIAAAIRKD